MDVPDHDGAQTPRAFGVAAWGAEQGGPFLRGRVRREPLPEWAVATEVVAVRAVCGSWNDHHIFCAM